MPNLNTANFTLTGMATKRSLKARLDDQFLSVKDFGATGNGSTDDTAAIQAAFDYAYGSAGSPRGEDSDNNKQLVFPAGNYKITQPLVLFHAYGVNLVGAGSPNTRLFWSGAEVEGDDDISSLLELKTCWNGGMSGLTLDAGGVQDVALRLMPTDGNPSTSSGSNFLYRDVHFTNAVFDGFFAGGGTHASEQLFVCCAFTSCKWGTRIPQSNALNHSFISCYFADNEIGYSQIVGGIGLICGCRFDNNSVMDIHHKQSVVSIESCYSTSKNFAVADGTIIGCTHTHASPGVFWSCAYEPPTLSTPYNPGDTLTLFSDQQKACLIGNHSSNGVLKSMGAAGFAVLVGNDFDSADYRTTYYRAGGAPGWEDGAAMP